MATAGTRMLVVVASTMLLTGAACGGGSDTPTVAEDRASAERMVLTSADLPDFTPDPDGKSDASSPDVIDRCAKDDPVLTNKGEHRGVDGTDFTKDGGILRVQSTVALVATESEAGTRFSKVKALFSGQCVKDGLKEAIQRSAPPGVKLGDVSRSSLPAPKLTEDEFALRFTIPVEAAGDRATVFVDETFLRRGRVVGAVLAFGSGSPLPEAERARLSGLVAARLSGKAKNTPDTGSKATTATTMAGSPKATSAAATAGFSTFRDPSGVSFEHPEAWTVDPSTAARPLIVYIDPPGQGPFRRNLNLLQPPRAPSNLDEFTRLNLKELNDIPGSTIDDSRPTTLSGFPAHRVSYRADVGGSGELHFLAVWTVRGDKAWQMTYSSDLARYDAGLPDVERLLTTLNLPA